MTENSITITTPAQQNPELSFLTDSNAFEHIWRVATAFSGSKMVPVHFQNKPQDTFVAIQMALQLRINPLLCLQNTQVINGRPSFSSQFMIGLANTRGPFVGPLTWTSEGKGDDLEVTCYATLKATDEVVSVNVSMAMAKADGWTKNAKYRSIPEQMLRYRSATWLIRLYCPEVTCGMQSDDEVSTMPSQMIQNNATLDSSDITPDSGQSTVSKVEALNAQLIKQDTQPVFEQATVINAEQSPPDAENSNPAEQLAPEPMF
tara:strand:+ start:933 stop:1715 length:783 start_codon:yes stop_codon:yes gene_type:complete